MLRLRTVVGQTFRSAGLRTVVGQTFRSAGPVTRVSAEALGRGRGFGREHSSGVIDVLLRQCDDAVGHRFEPVLPAPFIREIVLPQLSDCEHCQCQEGRARACTYNVSNDRGGRNQSVRDMAAGA